MTSTLRERGCQLYHAAAPSSHTTYCLQINTAENIKSGLSMDKNLTILRTSYVYVTQENEREDAIRHRRGDVFGGRLRAETEGLFNGSFFGVTLGSDGQFEKINYVTSNGRFMYYPIHPMVCIQIRL